MKKVVFIFYSLFFFQSLFSQEAGFDWAKSIGSSSGEDVRGFCVDEDGNSYVTGIFSNIIDFDPSPEIFELIPSGSSDIYIAKYDPTGNFEWAKSIGNTGSDVSDDIYVDVSNNLFITGYFSLTVDFDPDFETYELTALGGGDCFILKLNTGGDFIFARSFGDGLTDRGAGIITDESGNIYVTGTYQGTVDFDPGIGIVDITSNGEQDVFIQKLNSSGEFIWAKSIGGAAEDRVVSIEVDEFENIYFGGAFEGTIDLDPGVGVSSVTSNGLFDGYVEKLDTDGSYLWGAQIGGTSHEGVNDLAMDESGNVYSTGYFIGTVDFDPSLGLLNLTSNGARDLFVQKLDADGNLIWAKSAGSTTGDQGNSIAIDSEENVYTSGYYSLTMDFDPSAANFSRTANGETDIFIQKLDQDGNFIWAKTIGGTSSDEGVSLEIGIDNNIYSTGAFKLTADFNPGLGEFDLTSNGDLDIFILKLNACSPNATNDVINSCISYTWINGTTYYENNNSATVTLTNMLGCDSVVTLDLTINEVNITTTAVGGVLTSNATGATYQWLDCNDAYSEIAGATNQTYTPIDDGDYAVKVTIGSCTDTSACIAVDGVGLTDNILSKIHLYPNPNNGLFNINLGLVQATLIQISSANGTIIYSNSTNLTGIHQIALNISAGLYFVDVWTESGTYQMKLVVE